MQITIAVVQFEIEQFAPESNLAKAERFIQAALKQQAQIIVFPEDFVMGPLNGRADLADFDGRYVKQFQELAIKYAIDIVPGSIIEGDERGVYNTAYYIDQTGALWTLPQGQSVALRAPLYRSRSASSGLRDALWQNRPGHLLGPGLP
jgi:predicted amidohydrolase